MIFGDCPYCGESFAEPVPDKTPAYAKLKCETCGKEFWEKYSRLDPCAYTLEEFERLFVVDDEKKTVVEREPKQQLDPDLQKVYDAVTEYLAKKMANVILYGNGTENATGLIGKHWMKQ